MSIIASNCPIYFEKNLKNVKLEKSSIEVEKLYYEFIKLLSNLFQLSVKERNEVSSRIILNARFQIEEHVLNNLNEKGFERFKDFGGLYKHWQINFDTASLFKKALQFNEDAICEDVVSSYGDFMTKYISEEFPKDFEYQRDNHFEAVAKLDVVFEPLRIVNDFASLMMVNKKSSLVLSVFTFYYVIEQAIVSLAASDKTKCFVLGVMHNYKYEIFIEYSSLSDINYLGYSSFPFKEGAYIFEHTNCSTPYLGSLQAMELLFSKGKLNGAVINIQKASMLGLLRILTKNKAGKALLYKSISKFESLSQRVTESDSDYKKDIYIKLEEYLSIVLNWAEEGAEVEGEIVTTLQRALSSFTYKEKFKEELDRKGYIRDERMM